MSATTSDTASTQSDPACPVCATAELICGKWTLLVIRDLAAGQTRFCELERSLAGISPRTLSLRLRALEQEGVVWRSTHAQAPPRGEYSLTAKGRALLPLIDDMRRYGRDWLRRDRGEADEAGPAEEAAAPQSASSDRALALT